MATRLKLVMISQIKKKGIFGVLPHSTLNRKPHLVIPRIKREVNVRLAHLLELRGTPYRCYIDIHELVLISDNRQITKSRDMLDTPKLSHGHTQEVPCALLYTHQRNAK